MHLRVARNFLYTAVNRTQGTISDRSLAHIGLKALDTGVLTLAASDHVIAVFSQMHTEVLKAGEVFVPGRLFSDVVRELPDGLVELELSKTQLMIRAGKNNEFLMKLPVIEDGVWKEPVAIKTVNTASLPASKLSYMIDQVQFCVALDSARNYGAVGYLHKPQGERLRLVGSDGYRLSFCDLNLELPAGFLQDGICISKRALTELQRMCQEGFENIELSISEDLTTLRAAVSDFELFLRLSAVKYPNYVGVLPTANLHPVNVSRPHLQNVAKRVLLASDKSRALQMCFSESELTLSSRTAGSSEGRESVPLEGYKGQQKDLSVNGKFLVELFSVIASEDLTLQFKGQEDPIVIIPKEEPTNCRSMHVLVPIREQQ